MPVAESTRARVRTCAPSVGGGPGDRGDQPGVVLELAVPGQQAAAEAGRPQAGASGEGLGGGDPARAGQGLRGWCAALAAQQVAGEQPPRATAAWRSGHAGRSGGSAIGIAWVRCGAVTSIRMPRSTALSWATPTWPLAR